MVRRAGKVAKRLLAVMSGRGRYLSGLCVLAGKGGVGAASDGDREDGLELSAPRQVHLVWIDGAGGVAGDAHRGGGVGQGVMHDRVVVVGAQQDCDGGRVRAGTSEAVIDDGLELPNL